MPSVIHTSVGVSQSISFLKTSGIRIKAVCEPNISHTVNADRNRNLLIAFRGRPGYVCEHTCWYIEMFMPLA